MKACKQTPGPALPPRPTFCSTRCSPSATLLPCSEPVSAPMAAYAHAAMTCLCLNPSQLHNAVCRPLLPPRAADAGGEAPALQQDAHRLQQQAAVAAGRQPQRYSASAEGPGHRQVDPRLWSHCGPAGEGAPRAQAGHCGGLAPSVRGGWAWGRDTANVHGCGVGC